MAAREQKSDSEEKELNFGIFHLKAPAYRGAEVPSHLLPADLQNEVVRNKLERTEAGMQTIETHPHDETMQFLAMDVPEPVGVAVFLVHLLTHAYHNFVRTLKIQLKSI
jgi:hypothetical protein